MRQLPREIRHALRTLAGRPVLTCTTILTLTLGIGGTSALFTAANTLLLRPLPVPDADRVVRVFGRDDTRALGITSYANLQDVAERSRSFAGMIAHQQTFAAYGLGEDTTNAAVELVGGAYFTTLGIDAALGRRLTADDDRQAVRVVVISDAWWRRQFGADPNAVGRTVFLNGAAFTVVGVAPPFYRGSYDALATDLWAPLMTYDVVRPRGLDIRRRGWGWLQATARLTPGASLTSAQAELDTIAQALRAEYPRENADLSFAVVPASTLPEAMTPDLARALLFAIVVAALTLLAACANVANAALAAVTDRTGEIAVRMALGATRAAVARQWLVESLIASAAATALGLVLLVWLRDAAAGLSSLSGFANFAPAFELGWPVWLCAAALMTAATCLAGVLPALRASQVDPAGPLRDGAAANIGGSRGSWMRSTLLSAQAAVALALVALSALLGRSVTAAQWFDVGFNRAGLVVATANTSALGHDDARSYAYHADVMTRLQALPGATQVTAASVVPLGTNDERRGVRIDGYDAPGDGVLSIANNVVWPGYFEVMGIPLVAGRAFAAADGRPGAPLVAVVNQTMAKRYWPSGDPIGRTIQLEAGTVEIVGVATDIAYYAIGEAPLPYLYLAYGPGQPYRDGLTFHVRTSLDPGVMVRQVARELRAPDARVRVGDAMAYDDLRAAALLPARAMGWLSAGFGALALALFLVGIYGATAYTVAGRRRELALRLALGAAPDALRRGVVRRAVAWAVPGAVIGVLLAAAIAQLLRGVLVAVTPFDPLTLLGAAVGVLTTSALAAYVPVRRLGRTDLTHVLRS